MESSFIMFIVQRYPEAALHHGKGKGGLQPSNKADFTTIPAALLLHQSSQIRRLSMDLQQKRV